MKMVEGEKEVSGFEPKTKLWSQCFVRFHKTKQFETEKLVNTRIGSNGDLTAKPIWHTVQQQQIKSAYLILNVGLGPLSKIQSN